MSDIAELDDQRPHVVVNAGEKVHVVPVNLIGDWAEGVHEVPKDILRVIINDWLSSLN